MHAAAFPPSVDPAREPWEQDLLSLAVELSRRGGDVVPFTMAGSPLHFVNSAAGVQHVLVDQRHRYVSVPFPLSQISRSLTEPGAALLRQKLREPSSRPCPPPGELVTAAVDTLLDRLAAASRGETPLDPLPLFKAALLGLMTRLLFGVSIPIADVEAAAEAKRLLERLRAYPLPPGAIPRGTATWQRLQAASETEHHYSCEVLARAGLRELLPDPAEPPPRFDEEHLGLSAMHPVAIVSRLLMNSYNGPAIALGWLAWILGRQPAIQAAVATEAAHALRAGTSDFDHGTDLPFTRQVVQETLRLHPPAWLLARQATEDDVIGPCRVERNTSVVLSPYTLHRDERYWPDADQFRPERFDLHAAKPPPPGAYLPFGLGPGMCPASVFALKELQYSVARLAQRFELLVVSDIPVRPWGLISLHPAPGAALALRERAVKA